MPGNSQHFLKTWRRNRFLIISITLNILFLLICGNFLIDKFSQIYGRMYRKYIKGITSQTYPSYYTQRLEVFNLLKNNLKNS